MALPDITTLTDDELKQLQKQAGEEQFQRTQNAQIKAAAEDLITQAKFQGYTKTQVKAFLSNLADTIYAA